MKTIGLEIILFVYMLTFTFILTVGSIEAFKEMFSKKFDNSGDDDFEENFEKRTEQNMKRNVTVALLVFSGMNIAFTINHIIMMIGDIFL